MLAIRALRDDQHESSAAATRGSKGCQGVPETQEPAARPTTLGPWPSCCRRRGACSDYRVPSSTPPFCPYDLEHTLTLACCGTPGTKPVLSPHAYVQYTYAEVTSRHLPYVKRCALGYCIPYVGPAGRAVVRPHGSGRQLVGGGGGDGAPQRQAAVRRAAPQGTARGAAWGLRAPPCVAGTARVLARARGRDAV